MNSTPPHTVFVVEDDHETSRHIGAAIEGCPRLTLLGVAATCAEARVALAREPPNVLLTDLHLPDGNGVSLIREMRQSCSSTQIMVISVFADERSVIASVHAGATGYLLKDGTSMEICGAVLELLDGGSPLSAPVARYVLRLVQAQGRDELSEALPQVPTTSVPQEHKASLPKLTPREVEVIELLAKGFSCQEIANLLAISAHTVVTHSRSIHRKLEVNSRSAAVFEAISLGLIQLNG